MSVARWLKSLHGNCCELEHVTICLGNFISPNGPTSFRGRFISPDIRWKINYLMAIPFIYLAATTLFAYEESLVQRGLALLAIVWTVMGGNNARLVVLSHDNSSRSGDDNNLESFAPEDADVVGSNFCEVCMRHWPLQDHHCGGFGTCITKHNRSVG
jgi:hypothetical protein